MESAAEKERNVKMAKQLNERPTRQSVEEHEGHGGSHWWLMLVCCLPMVGVWILVILGLLNIR